MSGAELIAAERIRQVYIEQFCDEHDDLHGCGELVMAAICYLKPDVCGVTVHQKPGSWVSRRIPSLWPWEADFWKPKGRISDLVRAGALIAAEIDRLQRAASSE